MDKFPPKLLQKLTAREQNQSLRKLKTFGIEHTDFFSNDYLGLGQVHFSNEWKNSSQKQGSRLISGNSNVFFQFEEFCANWFLGEKALYFNSGYDANIGFFSCVPQRGDTVLYDEYIHASIRDGLQMGFAQKRSFKHNDLNDLETQLQRAKGSIFVVVESIYSMDGDRPNLKKIISLCQQFGAFCVVDEAHGTGLYGKNKTGLCEEEDILNDVFCRIHTFGKAVGSHGAVVIGNQKLIQYLINFCRSFIYTTAPNDNHLSLLTNKLNTIRSEDNRLQNLQKNIHHFQQKISNSGLEYLSPDSPIGSILIKGNRQALELEKELHLNKINCKAILSPTVPEGKERLRISLHNYNTTDEIDKLIQVSSDYLNK